MYEIELRMGANLAESIRPFRRRPSVWPLWEHTWRSHREGDEREAPQMIRAAAEVEKVKWGS